MIFRLIFFVFLAPSFMAACSCSSVPPFCEMASGYFGADPGNAAIAKVKYLGSRNPVDMVHIYDFVRLETLRGGVTVDTISFVGQDGLNCLGPFIEVVEGAEYILLHSLVEGGWDDYLNGYVNPHSLYTYGGCGHVTLKLEGSIVSGKIAEDISEIPLEELMGDLDQCAEEGTVSNQNPAHLSASVRVFPNPVTEQLRISVPEGLTINTVSLIDLQGRKVAARIMNGGEEISVADLPAGVYVALLQTDKGLVRKRVVKR